ncbi:MAG: FAD-binding oxidoreductase [Rhodobacteraceae bacterium]|nr:FAD-binding oxidoreductase [Paracoccaceae bacterium]
MQENPYWWDDAPRENTVPATQSATVDVVIVGAGFTGLNAALVLARAGHSVTVFEAGQLGEGASSRNGGMLGPSFHKLGLAGLISQYGEETTNGILRESVGFVDFLEDFLKTENIDAALKRTGRFQGALRAEHFAATQARIESLNKVCGDIAYMVPEKDQHLETGSSRFVGGVVYRMDAGLHPAKYHNGLIEVVRKAGVEIVPFTPVQAVEKSNGGFTVTTRLGKVKAAQVAICTNGYTGKQFPQFRRRILPIRSAIIATEPLAPDLMTQLMPKGRMYGDTRRIMAYYRPSPDGTRILFGGRASGLSDHPQKNARDLHRAMCDVYPSLKPSKISHVWSGRVGYAFDHAPHIGQLNGLDYAMGYCGSGVARASYFGQKLGYKMLGDEENGRTAFDSLAFQIKPFYTGNPWFMPFILGWHRMMDRWA